MYLSRIMLDTTKRKTMRGLAFPPVFHGAVESSFTGERKRRLWRLDNLNGKQYILIVSEDKPDFTRFAEQFGYEGEYGTKDYSPFLDSITEGSKWQFRLTANPSVNRRKENSTIRREREVLSHITIEHQSEWLIKRAEKNGFSLDEFLVTHSRHYRFSKSNEDTEANKHRKNFVYFQGVTYEGTLTVTEVGKFKELLCKGIGREKAYGMGLMTIIAK